VFRRFSVAAADPDDDSVRQNGEISDPASEPPVPTPPFTLPWPPLVRGTVALRPWGASDKDPEYLAAAWADADIARWTKVPQDRSRGAAKTWVAGEGVRRDSGKALDLCVTEAGAPEVIFGEVGMVLVEPTRRWAEIGYWLFPGVRGAGRASVAVDVFSDWVLHSQGIRRVVARIPDGHERSAGVVARAGFSAVGKLADGTVVWCRDAAGTVTS